MPSSSETLSHTLSSRTFLWPNHYAARCLPVKMGPSIAVVSKRSEVGTGKCILYIGEPWWPPKRTLTSPTSSTWNVRNIIFKRAGWGVELVTSQVYICVYIYIYVCVCIYLSVYFCIYMILHLFFDSCIHSFIPETNETKKGSFLETGSTRITPNCKAPSLPLRHWSRWPALMDKGWKGGGWRWDQGTVGSNNPVKLAK